MTRILALIVALTGLITGCYDTTGDVDRPQESTEITTASTEATQAATEEEVEATTAVEITTQEATETTTEEEEDMSISVYIGDTAFTATLEDNQAARELRQMLPLTINMRDYGGFEKVGSLGTYLTASDTQTVTQPGDIVLYSGNQIVIFYGSNSWSYTGLGRIDNLTGWQAALGSGDVTMTLRAE